MVAGVVAVRAKGLIGFLVLTLGLIIVCAPTLSAVEASSIGGKPANPRPDNPRTSSIFIHELNFGASVRDAVQVSNFTPEEKTLLVYATDAIISSGGVFGCAQKVDEKKAVGGWVTMDKEEVRLSPGQTEVVGFTIKTPATADVGENDGCIVIQEKTDTPQQTIQGENSAITLSFRTAIRLAVFLPGEVKKSVKILGYAAARSEDGNFVLKPRVKNDGNVSLDATLNTFTSGLFGGGNDTYTQQSPLLRNVTSDWNIPYKRPFWGGWIKSYFTISYDANIENSLGSSSNQNIVTLTSERIIFFSPPKPLALAVYLLVLLLLFALSYLLYRRISGASVGIRRQKHKSWRTLTINSPVDIETLARHYHISWKKLAKINRIKPPYILKAGDVVKVPEVGQRVAPKQKGIFGRASRKKMIEGWNTITIQQAIDIETLAKKYGVPWKHLARANRIKPPYILKANDAIKVPPRNASFSVFNAASMPGTGPMGYFARKRLAESWEYITIGSHVDGVINNQRDIEAIAKTYGVPWQLLAKINKLKPPYILRPGDRIKVPPRKQR